MVRNAMLVAVVVGAMGCELNHRPTGEPTMRIHGVLIYDHRTRYPVNDNENMEQRLTVIIERSLEHWGATWSDLDGYTVELVDGREIRCWFQNAGGCTMPTNRTIRLGFGPGWCIEGAQLPHEIGHAIGSFGDPLHLNPDFRHVSHVWPRVVHDDYDIQSGDCQAWTRSRDENHFHWWNSAPPL